MFAAVAMILQQIMTELSGAQSEEDRIMAHDKNYIKTREVKWPLQFLSGKYDFAGDRQQQL
jgi:hypothetical protein